MIIRFFHTIFFLVCIFSFANAQYTIKGRVNVSEEWQPKIFMASVNKLSDYYQSGAYMIVNKASVAPDGSFILQGDNLPNEKKFYRLYLMKKLNTDYDACLYVDGEDHNFVHVLLGKDEAVEIIADTTSTAPFGSFKIRGSKENQMMRTLSNIVFPSIYVSKVIFPGEQKLNADNLQANLKTFIDTCQSTHVSLAAINTTDFDRHFEKDKEFYQAFGERLKKDMPKASYTKDYIRKLRYYSNEDDAALPFWVLGLIGILSGIVIAMVLRNRNLQKQINQLENKINTPTTKPQPALSDILTQKEKQILQLIGEGKSNKEIASQLFVELSTVKTHINKLYSKIGASNRKEAIKLAKQQLNIS